MAKYIYVVMCEHSSRDGELLGMSPLKAFYDEYIAKQFAEEKSLALTSVQNKDYYVEEVELDFDSESK